MRWILLAILCLTVLSCREYVPYDAPVIFSGYKISGKVTSSNGIFLDSVSVRVYYNHLLFQTTPLDTVNFIVTDTLKYLFVGVFTPGDRYIRSLYFNYAPAGPLRYYPWNEKDSSGNFVPSGKYIIKYRYDNRLIKQIAYVADGHISTTTDSHGEFTLGGGMLPLGELYDYYNSNNRYDGTYKVGSTVKLTLTRGSLRGDYNIVVTKDQVTQGVFTIQ